MTKLKAAEQYPYFIRHVDGDTLNNHVDNIRWVPLRIAFKRLEWKVDWVCYLTQEEVLFVRRMLR